MPNEESTSTSGCLHSSELEEREIMSPVTYKAPKKYGMFSQPHWRNGPSTDHVLHKKGAHVTSPKTKHHNQRPMMDDTLEDFVASLEEGESIQKPNKAKEGSETHASNPGGSPHPDTTNTKAPEEKVEKSSGDFIDYVFGGVEKYMFSHGGKSALAETETGVIKDQEARDDIEAPPSAAVEEAVQQLHKIPKNELNVIQPQARDVLDYMFECGNRDPFQDQLTFRPTPAWERDALDRMFECQRPSKHTDSRAAVFRAPGAPEHGSKAAPPKSIVKETLKRLKEEEQKPSFGIDADDDDRADFLRKKKRELKYQRQRMESLRVIGEIVSSEDEGIGSELYLESDSLDEEYDETTVKTESVRNVHVQYAKNGGKVQHDREEIRAIRIRQLLVAGIAMFTTGATIILVGVFFLYPKI